MMPVITLDSTMDTTLIGWSEDFVAFIQVLGLLFLDDLLVLHSLLMDKPIRKE